MNSNRAGWSAHSFRVLRMRWPSVARFQSDERGAVAVYLAIIFPVLVGGMGLGVETGYWYWLQRELQHAADFASYAAGVRRIQGDTAGQQKDAALYVAQSSGPSALTLGDVTLNSPAASGNYTNPQTPDWSMEVILQRRLPRLFSGIFSDAPVVIRGRSVISSKVVSTACILALDEKAKGAVSVVGSANVSIDGCWVGANSNATDAVDFTGAKGTLATDCVRSAGTVDLGGSSSTSTIATTGLRLDECTAPLQSAAPMDDPYKDRMPPSHPGSCPGADGQSFGGVTLHCTNWTPSNNVTGIHIFRNKAQMVINGENIASGSAGVTFYFESGSGPKITGNPTLDFSAPTEGDAKGMLFWAADGNTELMKITGNNTSTFEGVFYAPDATIEWTGNGTLQGCVQIIADKVTFSGDLDTKINCPNGVPDGATPVATVLKVTIVE